MHRPHEGCGLSYGRAAKIAPSATARRASAVLRALALHTLARADMEVLRIAAGKARGGTVRAAAREQLSRLSQRERKPVSKLSRHRSREQQYLDLLDSDGALQTAPVVELRPRGRPLSEAA
ncbi:hypothetical protein [Streptomyces flavidovirens]